MSKPQMLKSSLLQIRILNFLEYVLPAPALCAL